MYPSSPPLAHYIGYAITTSCTIHSFHYHPHVLLPFVPIFPTIRTLCLARMYFILCIGGQRLMPYLPLMQGDWDHALVRLMKINGRIEYYDE